MISDGPRLRDTCRVVESKRVTVLVASLRRFVFVNAMLELGVLSKIEIVEVGRQDSLFHVGSSTRWLVTTIAIQFCFGLR